jgi:2-keto-4-pentenoate hydratase/2-oxohepta-3-ene-1,7-dioic acid hydratase in catechol pathway
MKLVRFGEAGSEKPGIVDAEGGVRDLSGHIDDVTGATLDNATLDRLRGLDPMSLPSVPDGTRLGACVGSIGKFLCIGLNYTDHAEETGNPIPDHPILFFKANSAISGPNDPIVMPRGSTNTDWEIELGVVIGKAAKYVNTDDALDYVAGYCVCNDVSERHFQTQLSGQWTKGKSCDTFGPTGPWMVTKDEIADVFSVAEIVSHLSGLFTLHPGDVISTGTPPGVGMGMTPPTYLKKGDVVELSIEGLGQQRQEVGEDV